MYQFPRQVCSTIAYIKAFTSNIFLSFSLISSIIKDGSKDTQYVKCVHAVRVQSRVLTPIEGNNKRLKTNKYTPTHILKKVN